MTRRTRSNIRSDIAVFGILLTASLPYASPGSAQDPEPSDTVGQPAVAERCAGPEFRQFDFWLGRWEVRNAGGELVGHNEIRRAGSGCGLLENWRGTTGGVGMSLNTYDADLNRWTQRWVGGGATLWLEGGLEEGPEGPRMVLAGPRPRSTPQGKVRDRLTWDSLGDGRVRQVWDVSRDGGESWEEIFRGLYTRMAADTVVRHVPGELEWREAPSGAALATVYGDPAEPGPFAFRMRMPPGFEMRPHSHDATEHLTVLSGTLLMRFASDGETVELPAGSAVSIPAGRPMWGWVEAEETVIQVHGIGPFRTIPLDEEEPGPGEPDRR